jgi:hypothetical protein
MSAEECFTALLKQIKRDHYRPTEAESSLLYYTLYSTYNPCALLWGLSGASLGLLAGRGSTFASRALKALFGFAYAQEFSWLMVEKYPATAFFRDLKGTKGSLAKIALQFPSRSETEGNLRDNSLLASVVGFLVLDHFVGPSLTKKNERLADVYSHKRGHAIVWLLLFDFGWIPRQNPYLTWYWRRNAYRLRRTYGTVSNR